MNFKTKRLFALFIIIIYTISLLPVVALASEDESSLFFDFEDEASVEDWLGAVRDQGAACEGDWGLQIANPYGDEATGIFGHILEYNSLVTLKEGCFYTFSTYVMNPFADNDFEPEASAYIGRNGSELFIDISSVGYSWNMVTASFMATEDMSVPLVITFEGGDIDIGFFMDSVTLSPETRTPEYTVLEGPDSVFIPESGFVDYRYNLVTYDSEDLPINVLINNPEFSVDNLPDGVEFLGSEGKLRVYSDAAADETFTLTHSGSTGFDIETASITITTTKNLLSDPSFEKGEENWTSDGSIN